MTLMLDKATGGMGDMMGSRSAGGRSSLHNLLPRTLRAGVTVLYKGKNVPVFRGGSTFKLRKMDYKLTNEGYVENKRGISLNTDASSLSKFGGAYRIESLPEGLKIIQRGNDAGHFEIVPVNRNLTVPQFQNLLDQVKVSPVKE
ncbi:hypothetical protein [Sphingobacterium sp. LRF_L2]|uniref:hypothetical protein n=1 Tax=Sphingobacterium sp. LRF_L2 TaxID=3369421 RepID=UPI003F60BD0C